MRRKLAYSFLVAFSLIAAAGSLSACNTMAGAGQDMQSGGKTLQNSADQNGAQPAR
jgi:predicted small secreted protein